MQLYLKRWGFTSQKPLTRATQRDPQKIAAWLRSDYPRIAARAKRAKAAIYWGSETGVCNQDQIGRGYAPKEKTPVLTQTGQKFSVSMIAAVSNRGLMRFKIYKGALNVAIFIDFIDFMKRLIKDAKQKHFLIVGNLRVHHAKTVQEWLAQHSQEIEIFYLPAYAPNTTRMNVSTMISSRRSKTNRAPRPVTTSSQPPRRFSNPSRGARIGSSHTSTQNTFAMLPE